MVKFIFPALLCFLGMGGLVEGIRDAKDNAAFRSHGETAQLLPIDNVETYAVYKQKRVFDEKKYMGVVHKAELTFKTKSGEVVTVPTQSLPPGLLDASRGGQVITIRYLPEKPTTIRLDGDEKPASAALALGGLLLFVGAYYIYRATRS